MSRPSGQIQPCSNCFGEEREREGERNDRWVYRCVSAILSLVPILCIGT